MLLLPYGDYVMPTVLSPPCVAIELGSPMGIYSSNRSFTPRGDSNITAVRENRFSSNTWTILAQVSSAIVFLIGCIILWVIGTSTIRELALAVVASYCLAGMVYFMMSSQGPQERGARLILVTVPIGIIFVALESMALMRVIDFRLMLGTPVFDPWQSPLRLPDPDLLWTHPPYLRLTGNYTRGNLAEMLCLPPREVQPYELRYDAYGFRNDSDLAKADIAVIGDSYVESPYAPTEALMTTVLSQLQRATVLNLGMSGFGPQQELVTLRRYAIPLGPKTIIWVFFEGNDLSDVHRYDALRADWSQVRSAAESLWERSFTKNMLLALLRLSHGCQPNAYYDKRYGVVHDGGAQPMRMYFGEEASALSPRDLDALEKTRSILTEAFEQTERHDMQLLVAFAPIAYRVYRQVADFTEAGKDLHWWTLSDLPDRLGRILSDISPRIGYVDLTPALVAAARQGRLVYLLEDTHWTTEGHAVVAMALNHYLDSAKRNSQH